jgi:hypothetical protein
MANHILRKDESNATKNLTDDDIKAIVALSKVTFYFPFLPILCQNQGILKGKITVPLTSCLTCLD